MAGGNDTTWRPCWDVDVPPRFHSHGNKPWAVAGWRVRAEMAIVSARAGMRALWGRGGSWLRMGELWFTRRENPGPTGMAHAGPLQVMFKTLVYECHIERRGAESSSLVS